MSHFILFFSSSLPAAAVMMRLMRSGLYTYGLLLSAAEQSSKKHKKKKGERVEGANGGWRRLSSPLVDRGALDNQSYNKEMKVGSS